MINISRRLLLLVTILTVNACAFDQHRQMDIHLPVELQVENGTSKNINIKTIYNSQTTNAGFVIYGEIITSAKIFSTRISQITFDAIKQGEYVIEGKCGDVGNWTATGQQLTEEFIENSTEWRVKIVIEACK